MDFNRQQILPRLEETSIDSDTNKDVLIVATESTARQGKVSNSPSGHVIPEHFGPVEIPHRAVIPKEFDDQGGDGGEVWHIESLAEISRNKFGIGIGAVTNNGCFIAIS